MRQGALARPFRHEAVGAVVLMLASALACDVRLRVYGTSILTGVGFTMSLLIGTLAFGQSELEAFMRLGVLVGSAPSALAGAAVLGFSRPSLTGGSA